MTDPTRRTFLKGVASTTAVAGIPAVGAETTQDQTETLSESPFEFEYRTVGDDVRNAVGRLWWLLTVSHDRIDELLQKSPTNATETRQKQDVVSEFRSTYEVELERDEQDERELTYHLTESRVSPLQETDIGRDELKASADGRNAVGRVAESVGAGLQQEVKPRVEPMHSGTVHQNMAAAAVQNTDYEDEANVLEDGSLDPDQWDQKCQVCSGGWLYLGDRFDLVDISLKVVEDEIRNAIRAIDESASPHHMYVPGGEKFQANAILAPFLPGGIGLLQVELYGAAPDDAQVHWENATSGYSTDFEEVGQAFHFLQDLSHPLHTGSIGPQVLDTQGTIHNAYKQFIDDNWDVADDTSKSFSERFAEGANLPQWDGSMKEACKTVANDSSNYSAQVYETIVENGPNNRDDWGDFVENSAYSCIWFAGACSRGAVNHL